ncbi:MAG: 4-hydroxythreonine-4-phosphate dehydrogenase PdxA [Chitinivibrionia bacterium]|nr:4-hydroxythreonine-4-phosphate dehydrogenase PdxA [Chitinivibrionia bacterium]
MRGRTSHPVIAVTIGDPAGIGPEITARFFAGFKPVKSIAVVIGASGALEPWAKRFGWSMEFADGGGSLSGIRQKQRGTVLVLDTGCTDAVRAGEHSRSGGLHAGKSVELACRLVNTRLVDAIVTAPISKKALNMAGYKYTGHTEMLADLLKSGTCEMMMVFRKLRVVPLTRHLPVSEVSARITFDGTVRCIMTVDAALRALFGIERPKIAVAALNPHAGDEGLLGSEEIMVLRPALEEARARGADVTGPVPGDVLFQSARTNLKEAFLLAETLAKRQRKAKRV